MGSKKGQVTPLLALGVLAIIAASGTYVATQTGIGPFNTLDDGNQNQDPDPGTGEERAWNDYKDLVGLKFPAQTSSETVVMIPDNVSAENYGSADVATVGADSDESDTTELFASADAEEGEDYYKFSTFDSKITSNLPDSGSYKIAVIGTGVANKYVDYEIPAQVDKLRVENDAPLQPLSDVDIYAYAADADITTDNTKVNDGSSTIALDSNFADDTSDSDVDGSVTGIKEYSVASDKVAQFGELSVSSVNSSVNEITMTVSIDGEQVASETDTDFSDNDGLDDGVEFGAVDAEDSITVETYIEYDDSEHSSASTLAKSTLDDTDDDSTSDDGSYGISALSTTWTGH